MDIRPVKSADQSAVSDSSHTDDVFVPRSDFPFKVTAFFWDSFRTWHSGLLRHIGFFHKRPAEVNPGQHSAQLLSGFADLLKIIVDACYYRRPLNPTWSPVIGYYCYDLFRSVLEADRLHMTLHDMAAEINPSLVASRGSCYVCSMARSFGTIIHSGLGSAWGHPMTWHGMASGNREGLFLVMLFRMAILKSHQTALSGLDYDRLAHGYEMLMQLLYMRQAEAEKRVSGGVSVGIQQFQREAESVIDDTGYNIEALSLLGFGGKKLMQLRNIRLPEIAEEIMDKDKITIQQHAETINNDYSQKVEKGFIGDNTGTVNFNEAEAAKQNEPPKKERAGGANPPNKEIKKLIQQILEDSDIGYDAMGLYSELHARGATIPEWVQDKPQVKQYISSFIGALRKDMTSEKKTISRSPYRIVPTDDA